MLMKSYSKEGIESLRERLKNASMPKIEGVFTVDDISESMLDGYHNGQERGTTTHIPQVDSAWTWRSGEVKYLDRLSERGKKFIS